MFVGLHAALAIRTGVEELAITPDEGEQFMTRAQAVMRHYSVETTQKTMDWIAFMGCAGMIYAPRAAAIWNAKMQRPSRQPQRATQSQGEDDNPLAAAFVHGPMPGYQ